MITLIIISKDNVCANDTLSPITAIGRAHQATHISLNDIM